MTSPASPFEIAYFQETTSGDGPNNAAAWVSNGNRFRCHSGVTAEAIQTSMIDDPRVQYGLGYHNDKIKGLEAGEGFNFTIPLPGAEVATAGTSQVATTIFANLLEHAMGGMQRGNRTTAKVAGAHTGTAVEVDSTTNIVEGGFVAWENSSGNLEIRRVTDITGDVVTVDQAFSATPQDADDVYPCIDLYIDYTKLCDSDAGPYTLSYLLQFGGAGSSELFELNGCKSALAGISLERNGLASVELTTMWGSKKDPTELSEPAWTAEPSGLSGVPLGPNTTVWLQDYGTTTANSVHAESVSIEPGIPAVRIPTVTSATTNLQGTARYSTQDADTMVTLNLVPFATSHWTNFSAGTKKVLRIAKEAPAGQALAIHFSRCEIVSEPIRGTAEAVSSTRLELRAHSDTANASASSAEQWRSKMHIVLA